MNYKQLAYPIIISVNLFIISSTHTTVATNENLPDTYPYDGNKKSVNSLNTDLKTLHENDTSCTTRRISKENLLTSNKNTIKIRNARSPYFIKLNNKYISHTKKLLNLQKENKNLNNHAKTFSNQPKKTFKNNFENNKSNNSINNLQKTHSQSRLVNNFTQNINNNGIKDLSKENTLKNIDNENISVVKENENIVSERNLSENNKKSFNKNKPDKRKDPTKNINVKSNFKNNQKRTLRNPSNKMKITKNINLFNERYTKATKSAKCINRYKYYDENKNTNLKNSHGKTLDSNDNPLEYLDDSN